MAKQDCECGQATIVITIEDVINLYNPSRNLRLDVTEVCLPNIDTKKDFHKS